MLLVDEWRDAWRSESSGHRRAIIAVVVIGAALRLLHLWQPIRYDEAVTWMYFARHDWARALSTYTYPNNHLLHTALVKASAMVLGSEPWVLRLPALFAGLLVLPASWATIHSLYGSRAALIALPLVATSGGMILYSTNARGYMLVVLAFLLLLLCARRILAGRQDWIALALVGALGLWTVPTMLLPLGAVLVWLGLSLFVENRASQLRKLLVTAGVTVALALLLYAPVISREGLAAITRNRFVAPIAWLEFFRLMPESIIGALSSWSLGVPPVISVVFLLCAAVALRRHASVTTTRVGLPLAVFVWCCWLLVVNHRPPFSRVWLWLMPLVAALSAAGVVLLLDRWPARTRAISQRLPIVSVAMALLLGGSVALSRAVFRSTDTGTYQDAAAATELLRGVVRDGDRVIAAIPTNAPLQYHMHRAGLDSTLLLRDERTATRLIVVVDPLEGQRYQDVVARSVARDTTLFGGPQRMARLPNSALFLLNRRNVQAR